MAGVEEARIIIEEEGRGPGMAGPHRAGKGLCEEYQLKLKLKFWKNMGS